MSDKEIAEQLQIVSEALNKIYPSGALVIVRDAEGLIHVHGEKQI